jgi:hypothetical protein
MKSDEAIKQIEYLKELTDKTRLKAAGGYPWFFIWGFFYIIGYIGSIFFPGSYFWWFLLGIGVLLSYMVMYFIRRKEKSLNKANPPLLKKIGLQCLILIISGGFIFSVIINFKAWNLVNAFWPFYIGVIYMVAGVHFGLDGFLIGFWITFVAIISLFISIPYQYIWLAVTAGGGMVFTGILFRYQVKKSKRI